MKRSKQKTIHKMEVQDDLGIRRRKKSKLAIPLKLYKLIKLLIIISIPVFYFICSPLLILSALAYFGLIIITKAIENDMNIGLKKDMCVSLPKLDSILCVVLIILTIAGMFITNMPSNSKVSQFDGMNKTELNEVIDENDFKNTDFKWMGFVNKVKNFSTLLTGVRFFFTNEKSFGRGGFDMKKPEGDPPTDMPENMNISDFEPPNMNDMLEDLPLSMLFESILKAVNTGLLVIIIIVGLLSLLKLKKIEKQS